MIGNRLVPDGQAKQAADIVGGAGKRETPERQPQVGRQPEADDAEAPDGGGDDTARPCRCTRVTSPR